MAVSCWHHDLRLQELPPPDTEHQPPWQRHHGSIMLEAEARMRHISWSTASMTCQPHDDSAINSYHRISTSDM